jgi:hypothetical protein
VHERPLHPELEQRELFRLLGNRHSGLPRLRTHCDDWELPHLHRVQLQHDVLVSNLLLHVRLGVRQRPLHPERPQWQLLRLHGDGDGRRARLRAGA